MSLCQCTYRFLFIYIETTQHLFRPLYFHVNVYVCLLELVFSFSRSNHSSFVVILLRPFFRSKSSWLFSFCVFFWKAGLWPDTFMCLFVHYSLRFEIIALHSFVCTTMNISYVFFPYHTFIICKQHLELSASYFSEMLAL